MAIRITGMYSGLDTESIINELASAQSYKKNKLVKAQTKLSWKQDAWKALNTKIYGFYQKLDDLRLQASYMKKKTTVSNPAAIKVTAGDVDGTRSVQVQELSKRAALTSGSLANGGTNYTGIATLEQLGFTAEKGSIRISDENGEYVNLEVTKDMKINDFVDLVNKNTAIKASYDMDNQRLFFSSWSSGKNGNFYFSANDTEGRQALEALKLLSATDLEKLTGVTVKADGTLEKDPKAEYAVWSSYRPGTRKDDGTWTETEQPDGTKITATKDYETLIKNETLERLKAMKAQNDVMEQENKDYIEANKKNLADLKELKEKSGSGGEYEAYKDYLTGFDPDWAKPENVESSASDIKTAGTNLYNAIYGVKKQALNDDNTPKFESDGKTPVYEQAKDENNKPLFEADGTTPVYVMESKGMVGDLKDKQKELAEKQAALQDARDKEAAGTGTADAVAEAEKAVAKASEAVSTKEKEISRAEEIYSFYKAYAYNEDKKEENKAKIAANNNLFSYTKADDGTETWKEKKKSGEGTSATYAEVAVGEGDTAAKVTEEFDKKVDVAKKMMDEMEDADKRKKLLAGAAGTKVAGRDSTIVMDGVAYHSYNDTFTINGLTMTALEPTGDKEVTLSTATDTEGIYSMIKDFIKAYSELMNEMDGKYNAEAAKDYEPLLSEEKEALSDTEVEEWEKKIKDSLLRRDSTLSNVSSAMRMKMMATMQFDGSVALLQSDGSIDRQSGVTLSLADFGIATLGYFNAPANERNAYHIDGDADDAKTKSNTDRLRFMIDHNPEALRDFFVNLTNGLHDEMADKMAANSVSSAMTVYNDKKMKEEYNDYTDKIKKQEEKLNSYIDKWYAKFSKMETALSKLQSKNSSLSSLFGG